MKWVFASIPKVIFISIDYKFFYILWKCLMIVDFSRRGDEKVPDQVFMTFLQWLLIPSPNLQHRGTFWAILEFLRRFPGFGLEGKACKTITRGWTHICSTQGCSSQCTLRPRIANHPIWTLLTWAQVSQHSPPVSFLPADTSLFFDLGQVGGILISECK